MKIYVSGTYTDQRRLRERAHQLHQMGHQITGTWLNEVQRPTYLTQDQWYRQLAVKDLAEVAAADCIICDLDGNSTSGGRAVEWGFALGRFNMLKVVVGGDQSGVFWQLADLKYDNWQELYDGGTFTTITIRQEGSPTSSGDQQRISGAPLEIKCLAYEDCAICSSPWEAVVGSVYPAGGTREFF